MAQGFKLKQQGSAFAPDRDQLQPHFDVERFGKINERLASKRLESQDASFVGQDRNEQLVCKPSGQHPSQSLLHLVSEMLPLERAEDALRTAATQLRTHFNCSYVMLAISDDGLKLQQLVSAGVSTMVEKVELRETLPTALLETMFTCRPHAGQTTQDRLSSHLSSPDSLLPQQATSGQASAGYAVQQLADQLHGCVTFISLPLIARDGRCVGAVFCGWSQVPDRTGESLIRGLEPWLNTIADLTQARQRSTKTSSLWQSKSPFARWQIRRSLWLTLACGLLLAVGLIPTAYPVRAKVVVEPDVKRWVSVPFDAPLRKVHVVPGQTVGVGQLLYSLDCRDLLNRLATLQADANRYASERSAKLVAGQPADAAIAAAQWQRVQAELELVVRYLDRAEVRSPLDGVVIGSDLKSLEGAPLKQGQRMIEVASLSSMHLKAEIPTSRIAQVVPGNEAAVSLASIGKLRSAKLKEVHARAEPNSQGTYVFEGHIELAQPVNAELMPGMSGYATLYGHSQPLAWCLVQRAVQWLQDWSKTT